MKWIKKRITQFHSVPKCMVDSTLKICFQITLPLLLSSISWQCNCRNLYFQAIIAYRFLVSKVISCDWSIFWNGRRWKKWNKNYRKKRKKNTNLLSELLLFSAVIWFLEIYYFFFCEPQHPHFKTICWNIIGSKLIN